MSIETLYDHLGYLGGQIDRLEQALVQQEKKHKDEIVRLEQKAKKAAAASPQPDLFGTWAKPVDAAANDAVNAKAAILATKLDSTIDKVQRLLREAGA